MSLSELVVLGAAPSTKPVVRVIQEGPSETTQILVALGAAIVGGLLTVLGDVVVRGYTSRRRFAGLKAALVEEVREIAEEAESRASDAGGVQRRPPLRSSAWDLLIASGELPRLKGETPNLSALYSAVSSANYQANQAPLYLQTANLSTDPVVQREFREEAERVSTEPYATVALAARQTLTSLDEGN